MDYKAGAADCVAPLALLLAVLIALVLVMAWFLIPFSVIKRKDEGGGYTMTFPWGD